MRDSRSITDDRRPNDRFERSALVIARPGHELGVHGWLEIARPLTFVISRGDRHQRLRLASTASVLNRAGACPGSVFGRLDDQDIYTALLHSDESLFAEVRDELATSLIERDVRTVLVAVNGKMDACATLSRTLAVDAARLASEGTGHAVQTLEATSEALPRARDSRDTAGRIELRLDDSALARKLRATRAYPLLVDVEQTLRTYGPEALRVEELTEVAGVLGVPKVSNVRGNVHRWGRSFYRIS